MKYKVIEDKNPKFEKKVNEAMKEGWEPIGGVSCYTTSEDAKGYMFESFVRIHFVQAMFLTGDAERWQNKR